jgi:hypothetical protein
MPNRMEKAASDVLGASKIAKPKIGRFSGVFQRLSREHGEVTALLVRVKMTSDAKMRAELFPKIRTELLSHERGALSVVYPAFRERIELLAFAQDHDRELGLLAAQIHALSTLAYDDARWADCFAELVDLVTRHAKKEEDTYFPAAQRVLGRQASDELLSRYEEAKARAVRTS